MPDEDPVQAQLTLAEKVSLLSGAEMWRTTPVDRLGIAALKMSDGPVGVRGDSTAPAACFPAPVALAATFDPALASATFLDVPGDGDRLHYREGLFVGHRWYDARELEPRIPFGHGLSYARFELGPPQRVADDGEEVRVRVPVDNRSGRGGRAVVQLYLEPPPGTWTRPVRQLAGFAAVELPGGEQHEVELVVARRRFEVWDPDSRAWVLPPVPYRLRVGTSSRELGGAVVVDR